MFVAGRSQAKRSGDHRRKRDRIARLLRAVGALATVPGVIAVGVWLAAFVTLYLDGLFHEALRSLVGGALDVPYHTASTVLSVIASSAITTLGLVYSIVLVVFTTAAGNIGPRLLQRFTGDRINQTTAGVFGGTFLFAITVLFALAPNPDGERADNAEWDGVPVLSVGFAFALAVLSVLQLILFVSRASRSVTVDVEVSEIADRLENDLSHLADRRETRSDRAEDWTLEAPEPVAADESGYVARIDDEEALAWAVRTGRRLSFVHPAGDFVMRTQPLAVVERGASLSEDEENEVRAFVVVEPSRGPEADVEFSINLLVEIALRALSPGVNDTYTAIACVDRLSSALAVAVREGLPGEFVVWRDEAWLHVPGIDFDGLTSAAFGPLRRASSGNVLMMSHLLKALLRLYEAAEETGHRERLLAEARRAFETLERDDLAAEDMRYLRRLRARFFGGAAERIVASG